MKKLTLQGMKLGFGPRGRKSSDLASGSDHTREVGNGLLGSVELPLDKARGSGSAVRLDVGQGDGSRKFASSSLARSRERELDPGGQTGFWLAAGRTNRGRRRGRRRDSPGLRLDSQMKKTERERSVRVPLGSCEIQKKGEGVGEQEKSEREREKLPMPDEKAFVRVNGIRYRERKPAKRRPVLQLPKIS
ncbi:hypothetical protein MA16_Dca028629 [Dendrobium catenatum]|uniref:Uncharacterized protein n=1 Tax=Dendrobium catenatum TaxID=906689 RepID=A0A2I0VA49_9ASPA|nr:hypothetical protein MA16_Dca028629 [Dendrobium catenatum]